MKGGKTPLGYTIVEVMVVLAVSSFMFLIASQFVNGKQARAAFTQGANDFSNKIESIAGQVNDGQFTDIPVRTCDVSATGLSFSLSPTDTQVQGTNLKCVFLGKMLYFNRNDTDLPQGYTLFNLAGALNDPISHNPITTLTQYISVIPGLTVQTQTPQSLEVRQMRVTDIDGTPHNGNYSVGFIQGLGTATGAGEGEAAYETGSQTLRMVYGTQMTNDNYSDDDAVSNLNGHLSYASRVQICVGAGNRLAQITVDLQTNGLNTDLRNFNNGTASCW